MTDIEYGTSVFDKNDKPVGTVDHIILDSWSGEPRKFVVRCDDGAVYFSPGDIKESGAEKVKLNLASDEMERT